MRSRLPRIRARSLGAAAPLVIFRRQWGEQSFWLATMAFSLATLGAITAGRSGFGVAQAIASRYATLSVPRVTAISVIFASQETQKRSWIGISPLTIVLLITVLWTAISFTAGLGIGRTLRKFRSIQQFVICTLPAQPDDAVLAVSAAPSERTSLVNLIRKYAAALRNLRYNVFADSEFCERRQMPAPPLPTSSATTECDGEACDHAEGPDAGPQGGLQCSRQVPV
jgi:hypothetical protein